MKLKVLDKNLFCFVADTQKELALTFYRVQEFYESQNPMLCRQNFDAFDFLDELMNDEGEIDYFSEWNGFNIPGNIFFSWMSATTFHNRSHYEDYMIDLMYKTLDQKEPFYVIGVMKGDKATLKHELSHALYYMDSYYMNDAADLSAEFERDYPKQYSLMMDGLNDLGYNYDVLDDELIAWMSTTSKKELVEEFGVDYAKIQPIVNKYRKLLRKYNTYI